MSCTQVLTRKDEVKVKLKRNPSFLQPLPLFHHINIAVTLIGYLASYPPHLSSTFHNDRKPMRIRIWRNNLHHLHQQK